MKISYDNFKLQFFSKFPNTKFEIIEKLETHYVLTKDKYGYCKVSIHHLLNGKIPSIRSALNPTEYFINKAKEVHKDKYDYSETIWINSLIKVKIFCNEHSEFFYQNSGCHLQSKGCTKCKYDIISKKNTENNSGYSLNKWIKLSKTSKYFDSFKIYILKCWNENEEFYKIGRTFSTVKRRYNKNQKIPYNYKIIKEIIGNSEEIFKLELELKNKNKEHKYLPLINFHGRQECFKEINI